MVFTAVSPESEPAPSTSYQDFLNREERVANLSTLVGADTVRVSLGEVSKERSQ